MVVMMVRGMCVSGMVVMMVMIRICRACWRSRGRKAQGIERAIGRLSLMMMVVVMRDHVVMMVVRGGTGLRALPTALRVWRASAVGVGLVIVS